MANWTQKKLLLAIGGTSLALCLTAGGGIYYTAGLIEEVEAQVEEKEKSVAAADQKIALVPALEKDVIILRENLDEYVKILPNDKELSDFLRMLSQFNRQSGVQARMLQNKQRREAKGERFTPIEYTYELTATLWQCMKFMNLVENFERFVSITDFSIQSGGDGRSEDTRDGDVVHKVKLTLQTYAYNGKVDSKEVQIAEYKNKKDALREEIWKRLQAIRLDRYEHRGEQGRRDVLIDPRERGDLRIPGPSLEQQRAVVDRNVAEVARLHDMQAKIKKQDTTLFEQYSLEKGLKEGLEKLDEGLESDAALVNHPPLRLRWAREVVLPLDELRGQIAAGNKDEPVKKDPYLPLKRHAAAGRRSRSRLQQRPARAGEEPLRVGRRAHRRAQRRPAPQARRRAKAWHNKAATALDFKALDLKVQGVVVNREGRSGVLLNGDTYEEGEYVSDDLLVKLVEEEQVWFVFRGLTLVRTM
jgi:Tfp pilus assembly protein PilO